MADGFQVSGDVVVTSSGAVGVWYTPTATSSGALGNMRPLYFSISSASSNGADVMIDVTGGGPIATTSASYRLRPGKTFPPFPAERPGSNAGYSGFSALSSTGSQWLIWSAWR